MTANAATAPPAATTVTVGAYLARRLAQLGVQHLFGLPGDFNLALLDEVLAAGEQRWVGSTNELNAGYCADGYARLRRGPAAFVTTFGVGELSAVNALAGSFAEDVPVVHVVGMPATRAMADGALLHHSLADGDFGHFARVAAEVTASAVVLRPHGAATAIDQALLTAVSTSKPVYLGVPADVAVARVSAAPLARPLRVLRSDAQACGEFAQALAEFLDGAPEVTVLAGPRLHRRHLEERMRRIAAQNGVRVATQSASKALLDESHPANLGVYAGEFSHSQETRTRVDSASPLVLAGAVMTDFLTGSFTHGFDPDAAVDLQLDHARIAGDVFHGVHLDSSLRLLLEALEARRPRPEPLPRRAVAPAAAHEPAEPGGPLTHADLWPLLQDWLAPGTLLVAEAGTSFYGAVELTLPDGCDLLGQPVWSSIGYTLPAALGAVLAAPERETVLVIGDGSAQLTVQELGRLLGEARALTVLLLNNGGYTVERAIRSPEAPYQDITAWDWTALPAALGAPGTSTHRAGTPAELVEVLGKVRADTGRPALVEVVLPRDDAPESLVRLARSIR
ncbi:thiamine pyrophosphate-dependent enzyme [Paenibacillus sp. TRM 82003]|uniref:alpha-keto acid decarboxylase family protein n=1 Tax=Kineococcus sp. TRM81007 TaxID=2925831 RepID=UPI001F560E5A|nr:thiamine pyrophosphate-binding protein [Kineococcus sp. TRM81007]MCI2238554.1 thiamine pyrophosphate-dependent enzyme [Kineococcus sp. TRM81007]MCI3925084.1 thiamine pyrophosphate-dependent enzyme [Paenibacillus sp. TRM 82003]